MCARIGQTRLWRWRRGSRAWTEADTWGQHVTFLQVPAGWAGAEHPPASTDLQRACAVHLQSAGVRVGHPQLLCADVLSGRTKDPVSGDESRTFRHGTDWGELCVYRWSCLRRVKVETEVGNAAVMHKNNRVFNLSYPHVNCHPMERQLLCISLYFLCHIV